MADGMSGLLASRAAYQDELADPRVRSGLLALTHAEVGSQGPEAQQAFMESVVNRAAARGKSLADTIYDRGYFPSITHQRMASGIPSGMDGHYGGLLDKVLGGSNVSNYATGNASGTVGFAGGPQTFAANGERFGVEGPDRSWASRMGAGPGSVPASVASAPASPASPPRASAPMAQNELGQYIPDELIKQQGQMAQNYWGMRPSGGKFSLAEGLLSGFGSAVGNAQAANSVRSNQELRSRVLSDAASSGKLDLASMLRSGIPEMQDTATKIMAQQADPMRQVQLEQSQLNLANAKADAPVDRALKVAQTEKAQREMDAPQWDVVETGKDQYGNPIRSWVNKRTQEVKPISGKGAAASGVPQTSPTVTGDEFLKTLPPSIATQVKGIAEGRIPYPGAFALKQPYWQKVTEALSQYEPGADSNLYRVRYATQKDMATGKMGQNVASFNTALGHMYDLYNQVDGLGNSNVPMLNAPINAVRGAVSDKDQAKLKAFETTLSKVNAEVEKAFKGSGATVHDLEEAKNAINVNMAPATLKAATKKLLELMESRIEAIGDQYNRGMQIAQPRAAISLLSPKSQKIVEKLKGEGAHPDDKKPVVGSPPPSVPPASGPKYKAVNPENGHVIYSDDGTDWREQP